MRWARALFLEALGGLLFSLFVIHSCAETFSGQRLEPGRPILHESYIAVVKGAIIGGKMLGNDKQDFTNIRIQPFGTPLLFDQSILFCGDQSEEFIRAKNPVVIKFDPVAHQMFEGVACYDLISVEQWRKP